MYFFLDYYTYQCYLAYFCGMTKYSFAGHETFPCRNYWLKKGLDHLWSNRKFNDEAVIPLGVGRNMVNSIRFWLKAFGLTENGKPNEIAEYIFKDSGLDPFCEDVGSIWLLHYLLVTSKVSSIYSLIFNEFRKKRIEFTKDHLTSFIDQKCSSDEFKYHINSIKKDVGVFLNNYSKPSRSKTIEDDFSGLLYELNLVEKLDKYSKVQWYSIENKSRQELPAEIVLFCILWQNGSNTVSFNELLNSIDSVGTIFALNSNGLMHKIENIIELYPKDIIYTDDGGIRVLQFRREFDKWEVLNKYYEQ